jgi:hypothetical protein
MVKKRITRFSVSSMLILGVNKSWDPKSLEKLPCFLPFWKADDTASPLLSKVRGSLLQLHP